MELNIKELEYDEDNDFNYEQEPTQIPFEDIPENNIKIKVNKKGVQFKEPIKPINQPIPRENAKMVRPKIQNKQPQISYEDIMAKMGMFVANGKLHLLDEQNLKPQQKPEPKTYIPNPQGSAPQQNSYIYNKYFQNSTYNQNIEERPLTPLEYRNKLINDIIQKQKIRQMKSTKLIMPNSNINFAQGPTGNLNKLFGFSHR
jgi:hypothetical protein